MDNIMYEKLNIGPTLYFNEKLYRQSLNKKWNYCTFVSPAPLLLLMTHHEEIRLNALP